MDKKGEKSKPKICMFHIRLSEDIQKIVHVQAAEADTTIQDWVLEAIQEHLKTMTDKKL